MDREEGQGKQMKADLAKVLIAGAVALGLAGCAEYGGKMASGGTMASGDDDPVELVLGTDGIKSPLFGMGNGLSAAVALNAKGVAVFNYATKGTKDNLKRLTKKKRAINLAAVLARGLGKSKLRAKVQGVATLGSTKKNPDWVILVVRPKPPKGVSRKQYEDAIYNLVLALQDKKTEKMMGKVWKRWSPQPNPFVFENVGVKLHPGAIRAYKKLGRL